MFVDFFFALKKAGIPTTIREYLVLMEAMDKNVAERSIEEFYYLARCALVKDERYFDRFDLVFDHVFKGAEAAMIAALGADVPEAWLRAAAKRVFTEEELAKLDALGFDALLKAFAERMAEQRGLTTAAASGSARAAPRPSAMAASTRPASASAGRAERGPRSRSGSGASSRGLAGGAELGTRNIKMALRRLRRFAREGMPDEFDLDGTIRATADNAGWLDIRMQAERRNRIKVLLLLDIGGSMDWHVRASEQLFTAARAEFRHLESYYFHNCVYETVWREDARRRRVLIKTAEIVNTYGADWRLVFVGDAAMSPFELTEPGGSVSHFNEEAGQVWLKRLAEAYPASAWLNPVPEDRWSYATSTKIIHRIMGGRMYPLTMDGLDRAMTALKRG